jgi:hypothetical protein
VPTIYPNNKHKKQTDTKQNKTKQKPCLQVFILTWFAYQIPWESTMLTEKYGVWGYGALGRGGRRKTKKKEL